MTINQLGWWVRRDGKRARVVCLDLKCNYPVVAVHQCDGDDLKEYTTTHTVDGRKVFSGDSDEDLIRPFTEPRFRPWKPEEVPVGAQARMGDKAANDESGGLRSLIVAASDKLMTFFNGSIQHCNHQKALDTLEHSTDGGKTWQPCGIQETQP